MDRLPSELYEQIGHEMAPDSLRRLVTISRPFQAEAERVLFSHVIIRKSSAQPLLEALEGLSATPRFWPLIHEVTYAHISRSKDEVERPLPLLASFLERLPGLSVLTIASQPLFRIVGGKVLRNCHFQLRTLRCPFILDGDFASFLSTQQSLVEFDWSVGVVWTLGNKLQGSALPALSVLVLRTSFHSQLRAIIPGRNISHIKCLSHGYRQPFRVIDELKGSNVPIRSLYIPTARSIDLAAAQSAFPSLEYFGYFWYPLRERYTPLTRLCL
jgi:hypothetical protein